MLSRDTYGPGSWRLHVTFSATERPFPGPFD
eukprot:COSAG02_NODE_8022_length_2743_cov_3.322239_4_plen_30_part_01